MPALYHDLSAPTVVINWVGIAGETGFIIWDVITHTCPQYQRSFWSSAMDEWLHHSVDTYALNSRDADLDEFC